MKFFETILNKISDLLTYIFKMVVSAMNANEE